MATQQPNPTPKPPESHYDPNKLGFYFAMVALLLLTAVVGLLMKDYSREWKNYQQKFRSLEVEKTRVKLDKVSNDLAANEEYQTLKTDLDNERKAFNNNCSKLDAVKKEIAALQTKDDLLNQQYKFKKTSLDVTKFQYEAAIEHQAKNYKQHKDQYQQFLKQTDALKLAVENSATAIKVKQQTLDSCGSKLKELTKKESSFSKQAAILQRKLNKVDTAAMSLTNQLANTVRDFPILDLSNPNYKVDQIVLKDITEDVNFLQVPRVDRCTTCHLGIANPDYKNAAQPFRTHPNLELFLGNNSPHPMEEFGCTVCHQGRGRGTSFTTAAHTPSSEEEKKKWEKKYHFEEMHHWDEPMLKAEATQASCFKCHSGQMNLKGAEKLNLGLQLIERSGCYSCHFISKYKDWPKTGPDLTHLAKKINKEFAYRWISSPKLFRHNTWMPSYFYQTNNSDPLSIIRNEQEIHSIVSYLFKNSEDFNLEPVRVTGNAKNGEELVSSIGCFACHKIQPNPVEAATTQDSLRQEQGPNLIGLGSKTSMQWIYNWLKNPSRYHPETKMPSLRLSDQEAADIAAYLSVDKNKNFENKPIPEIDEEVVNEIALDFLQKNYTKQEAKENLVKMSLDEKLAFNGEKLIGHYGCFACHKIKGFENAKPIGTDLTEEGNKPADKLDFGFIDIEHSKEAWFHQKLINPRIFDKDKIKSPTDKLIMPNFNFSHQEAEAISTALQGFVKDKTVTKKMPTKTVESQYIEDGEKIVRQLNCQGCHNIDGEGRSIQHNVKEWLIKNQGKTEAEAETLAQNFAPPTLQSIGQKLNPEWLFEFLHSPTTTIRPWLKVRMPTYQLNTAHLNALIKYFNAKDKAEFPFMQSEDVSISDADTKEAEKLFLGLDCMKCHVVGEKMPNGTQDTWAPNLALAHKRLRADYILKWIKNPQKFITNTKMPAFLDTDESGPPDIFGGDENVQLKMLRNYLMHLSTLPTPGTAISTEAVNPSTTENSSQQQTQTPVTASQPADQAAPTK